MTATPLHLPIGPLTFDAVADGPLDGEPALLLHGFPESGHAWRRVQPLLAAAGIRSVAPDLRGYSPGARPADPAEYAIDALVADVLGLADALGWDTFHLVGHDWGGALAWHTAGRFPDRLRTLSVVSTPHPAAFLAAKHGGPAADGDDQAARSGYMATFRADGAEDLFLADDRALLRMLYAGSGLDEQSAAAYVDRFTTFEDLQGALNWYKGADPADASGLGPITTPTLYVWSTEDIALGRTAAELTAGEVEGPYTFVELEGVSHWIPEEAPEALAAALVTHLG
ncbi:alpha/beta hydrolase [Aquihabitans sp. G128]|uniref:alpha/beta fold hydrolase n=1 Tax=Aquihabitans sp. G128 TaxID=2849779 RepID=UPI001C21F2A1|nr:alpha/beta hydrolase [Aquihabitans sp. G128]QXC63061.1 alpha/beta hydrolase [Aquihabitans sp. G128]